MLLIRRADGRTTATTELRPLRLAQSDAPAETESNLSKVLDEVVVTGARRKFAPTDSSAATKIPMSVLETPQALSVLSSELLDIVGITSINGASALAPSMMDQEAEVPLYIDTVARGFEVNFWNGNKINGMPFRNSGSPLDLGIADRVEVVRGPSSIIYGQSDYGATLNVTLKSPLAKRQFAGELGASIEGGHRALLDVTGPLTSSNRLRGRLIIIDDETQPAQSYVFSRTRTVAPSISWDILENTTLDLNFYHSEREFRHDYGFGLAQNPLTGEISLPNIDVKKGFFGADWGISNVYVDYGVAKLSHKFSNNWTLSLSGANQHSSLRWHEPYYDGYIDTTGNGDMTLWDYWSNEISYDRSLDLTLSGDFQIAGRSQTFMISGYQRTGKNNVFQDCCEQIGFVNVYDPQPRSYEPYYTNLPTDPEHLSSMEGTELTGARHIVQKEDAVSGLLLLHPIDRLTVMLGLRFNKFERTAQNYFDRSFSYQVPANYENDATNKRIGLVYEILDGVNVYGSYSDGVIFNAAQKYPSGALPAEVGEQYEIGAKASLLNNKLVVSAAAFVIDRNNVAVHDPSLPPSEPYSITLDGQTHKGFELEAMGEPIPGWNILSSYAYLDVQVTDAPDPAMIGQQRANAPHHMAKLFSTYQLQDGPLYGLSLGGGLFYASEREVDNFGTFRLPAYTRLDLRLGYDRLENISFSVNFINVTDEKIYVSTANAATSGLALQARRAVFFRTNFKY